MRSDRERLLDILEAIGKIEQRVSRNLDVFADDDQKAEYLSPARLNRHDRLVAHFDGDEDQPVEGLLFITGQRDPQRRPLSSSTAASLLVGLVIWDSQINVAFAATVIATSLRTMHASSAKTRARYRSLLPSVASPVSVAQTPCLPQLVTESQTEHVSHGIPGQH